MHTPAQKCFIIRVRVRPCEFAHLCAYAYLVSVRRIHRGVLCPFEEDIRAQCVRAPMVLFLREKQTRIPFLMRTGAKVFYNVGEDTRAYIRFAIKWILTYRVIPFARTEPVALAIRDVDRRR